MTKGSNKRAQVGVRPKCRQDSGACLKSPNSILFLAIDNFTVCLK